jgi:hypothetical protein
MQVQPIFDLDNFDLSSHEGADSQSSFDYSSGNLLGSLDRADPARGGSSFFKSEAVGGGKKAQRYSPAMKSERSEGEVAFLGAGNEDMDSSDEISIGEIRVPSSNNASKKYTSLPKKGMSNGVFTMSSNMQPQVKRGGAPSTNLAETINYEEDKVSPEKDHEKPIYESSEGPIPKHRPNQARAAKGKGGVQ